MRLYAIGHLPPGLYRDEAVNGLDAVQVLAGEGAWYFPANNGREPAYIYLTAPFVAWFGRTPTAVRLGAALAGTLTTLLTFLLAAAWFGRFVGLTSAWLWAVTFWPLHLSRIGFRAVLLPGALALALWLATRAWRGATAGARRRWFVAGIAYGLCFYTYLAIRVTPPLLLALALFFAWRDPAARRRLWPDGLWAAAGTVLALLPLLAVAAGDPGLVLGRSGQVSILNPAIHGGDLWGTLVRHAGRALGMFVWRGDIIWRHNLAGRPVFDLLLAGPFLLGFVWTIRHWRRPAALTTLALTVGMLAPTILAEDTPHFLRAVGVLPAALIVTALGLRALWRASWLAPVWRAGLLGLLLAGSAAWGFVDYFGRYATQADVGYLFEAAALELASDIAADIGASAAGAVFVDERYWLGWPTLAFVLGDKPAVTLFSEADGLDGPVSAPFVLYIWPHGQLSAVPAAVAAAGTTVPVKIAISSGSLARGDLEPAPYAFYNRYFVTPITPPPVRATFDGHLTLHASEALARPDGRLQVQLEWSVHRVLDEEIIAFVHVIGPEGLLGQHDAPPGDGHWPWFWWRPEQVLSDGFTIELREPFDPGRHQIIVGLYDALTSTRLPVFDATGAPVGDTWSLTPRE